MLIGLGCSALCVMFVEAGVCGLPQGFTCCLDLVHFEDPGSIQIYYIYSPTQSIYVPAPHLRPKVEIARRMGHSFTTQATYTSPEKLQEAIDGQDETD
jgi:hypothetical protein